MSNLLEELASIRDKEFARAQKEALERYQISYEIPGGILDFGEEWRLTGDWMIVGDIHVPMVRWGFAALLGDVAKLHMKKPRKLLIAGDLFNMDKFSSYENVIEMPTWSIERDSARKLITGWLDVFDEILLITGNHERRLQKYTMGAFDTRDILAMVISNPDKVKMTGFGFCWIESGDQLWRVTHPKGYSKIQLRIAEQLCYKFQANMITFHEHHLSVGWDLFGKYMIVNGGSLIDTSRVPYQRLDDTTSAVSKTGFVMLKDGVPTIYGEHPFTNWREVLKKKK